MKKSLLGLTSILFFTVGCASKEVQIQTEVVDYNKDVVIQELRQTSKTVSEALMIMARNDNALKSKTLTSEQIRNENAMSSVVLPGMERIISFDWNGPAMNALKALADTADYDFRAGGIKPVAMLEPLAYINHEDSIMELIRLIQSQTKDELEINVHVFEYERFIEVNYVR
jgi:hypothetical protein